MRILHVEDDYDIREIARLSLATIGGFDILQCSLGREALQQAEDFKPDLFLLDVIMPGMTGPETLRSLRQIESLVHIPAIFMTSITTEASQVDEVNSLSIGTIQKPFDPMDLPNQIRQICDAHGAT